MSIYGIDMGHPDNCGANGFMSETDGNRAVGRLLIAKLKAQGNMVIDCTITDNNNELARRVARANAQHLDYFISLHLDCYNDPSANGATIYTTANSGAKEKAQSIINLVAASCNYNNRGWKSANFYVLVHTNAPAMLIEMGFVSNKEDCNKFNAEALANAIVEGLTGHVSIGSANVTNEPQQVTESRGNDWIRRLQNECNNQGFSKQVVDGLAGPNTLDGCPTLLLGNRGNITYLLQEKLVSLGYDTNGVDGIFGSGTRGAVISYQNAEGIVADGIVGEMSWSKLLGLAV